MPAWIKNEEDEAAWQSAKKIVSEQRKKKEADFGDRDWGLVTHIAKNMLKGRVSSSYIDTGTIYALSNVERILDNRRKKERRNRDTKLSASDQSLVSALSQVAALGGQTVAALRDQQGSRLSASEAAELTDELQDVANRLRDVLLKVKG
jgi:hypothetical protein